MRRLPILLLLTSLLALAMACTETGSLPTAPGDPSSTSDWSMVYPILVNESLNAAWGLDADDMWAVGDLGTILHYDGERCTVVESPVDRSILAIHGRARDDVWAVTSAHVLHWNGHRWRVVRDDSGTYSLLTIWCADSGDIFVGGRDHSDGGYVPVVLRHDGSRWWHTNVPRLESDRARRIWQPEPGGPALLATDENLFRYGNSWWTPTATQIDIIDVDGTLALGRDQGGDTTHLIRFGADGEPFAPCPADTTESDWLWASDVADSRLPLVERFGVVATVGADCELTNLPDQFSGSVYDFAVPILPGTAGPTLFAAGSEGMFLRGLWNDDQSITWQPLVPGPTDALSGAITGTAARVFGSVGRHRLLVGEDAGWRVETFEGIPYSPLLDILPDGSLVAWRGPFVSIRRPTGDWHELPEPPDYPRYLWTDGDAALMYDNRGREWVLDGGQWALTDSIASGVYQLAGRSADEIYRLTGDRFLERRVGDLWEHVLGGQSVRVGTFYLSPWSNGIYLFLTGSGQGSVTALLQDGIVTILAAEESWSWDHDEVCEARPDDFYRIDRDTIRRLVAGNWHESTVPGAIYQLTSIWGHPDQGLYVRDYEGRLFHRPFPETDD